MSLILPYTLSTFKVIITKTTLLKYMAIQNLNKHGYFFSSILIHCLKCQYKDFTLSTH